MKQVAALAGGKSCDLASWTWTTRLHDSNATATAHRMTYCMSPTLLDDMA